MAAIFVRAEPPRSPVLLYYGDGLPAFVERFEPASSRALSRRRDPPRDRAEPSLSRRRCRAGRRPADLARLDAWPGSPPRRSSRTRPCVSSPRLIPSRRIAAMHAPGRRARADRALARRGRSHHPPAPPVETRVLPPGGHAFVARRCSRRGPSPWPSWPASRPRPASMPPPRSPASSRAARRSPFAMPAAAR